MRYVSNIVALSAFKIVKDTFQKDELLPNCKFISHINICFVALSLHGLGIENICFLIFVVKHIPPGMVELKKKRLRKCFSR